MAFLNNNTWYSCQSFSTDYYLTADAVDGTVSAGSSGTEGGALWQIFQPDFDSPVTIIRSQAYGVASCMATADVPSSPSLQPCRGTSYNTAWFLPTANFNDTSDGWLLSVTWPFYTQNLGIDPTSLALTVTNDTNGTNAQDINYQWGIRSVSAINDPSWSQLATVSSSTTTSTNNSSTTLTTNSSTISTTDSSETLTTDSATSSDTTVLLDTITITTSTADSTTTEEESSSSSSTSASSSVSEALPSILTLTTTLSVTPETSSSVVPDSSSETASEEQGITSTQFVTSTASRPSSGPRTSVVVVTASQTRPTSSTASVASVVQSGAMGVSNPVKHLGHFSIFKTTLLVVVGVLLTTGYL